MSQDWNEMPKIKMEGFDSVSFDAGQEESYKSSEDYSEIGLSSNDYYSEETSHYAETNVEPSFHADEVDLVSKNRIDKKTIFYVILMLLIVIVPISYHFTKNLIETYFYTETEVIANVQVNKYPISKVYTTSEAIGLITPEASVDVVSRADGFLQNTLFKEGDFVKKGQLLFKIEPNELQIIVRSAEASVAQAQALYVNAIQELERAKELIKENFISRSDYDSIVAQANSSKASLDAAKQELARAKLNLSHTNVYSPLTGKAGKIMLSNGNYVTPQTLLVNVAKTSPICVSFSIKSADVIQLKTANGGKLDLSTSKVELILADNTKYKYTGKINFLDNMIASDAATLLLKAVFENPDNILVPGDYVKVVVTSATPSYHILLPHSVVYGDAVNGYYVWTVVNNKTIKKDIEVIGSKLNNWIIKSGVSPNDDIIVQTDIPIDMDDMPVNVKDKV